MNLKNKTRIDLLEELIAGSRSKWLQSNSLKNRILRPIGNKEFFSLPLGSCIPRELIRLEPWEIEYIYSVATNISGEILEIGRYSGGSTLVLAAANLKSTIWSIDIAPQNDDRLKNLCSQLSIGKNLKLLIGDSSSLKNSEIEDLDLLFIDGDHSYLGCKNDMLNWWPKLRVGGHMILHDCYLGSEVQKAAIDFLSTVECRVIVGPWRGRQHYRCDAGSLCHVIKSQ